MKYWDTSALVPIFVEESHTEGCKDIAESDPEIMTWFFTTSEVLSALWRRYRRGEITRGEVESGENHLAQLSAQWIDVSSIDVVRDESHRLLRMHALRAADALQLAAAIIAFDHRPKGHGFVCLDENLCAAADLEGFQVIRPAARKRN
ncbi:MAG: type II toxin-antitoxin system VapC family toxin [Planctomycetes bacterium]|nr:type II toxin-antitoxin system VapC family toxin [Planctomycetota bacterium]